MNFIFNNTQEALRICRMVSALVPKELLEKLEGINVFLCGGVFVSLLTGDRVRDLDFFFASEEDYKKAYDRVCAPLTDKLITFNAVNFKINDTKIQFITKLYIPTVQETLSVFDIRAAMCGMTLQQIKDKSGFYSEENSLFDIAKKMIVIMPNHRNPHNVVFRIAKFVKRGWDIKGQSFVRLILQQLIRAKYINTLGDVRDEILGLDTLILTQFFKQYNRFPPEQPLAELELKEIMTDIDTYFDSWKNDMDVEA